MRTIGISFSYHRSSHSQMFFKIIVLKNFAIFAEKLLCWSFFLIKFHVWRPTTLLKRDSTTQMFSFEYYEIFKNFQQQLFLKNICKRLLLRSSPGRSIALGGDYMIPVERDEILSPLPGSWQCYKLFISHVKSFIPARRNPSFVLPGSRFAGNKFCRVIVSARLSGIKKLINISVWKYW